MKICTAVLKTAGMMLFSLNFWVNEISLWEKNNFFHIILKNKFWGIIDLILDGKPVEIKNI